MTQPWTNNCRRWTLATASLWLLAIFLPPLTMHWGSPVGALSYLFFKPICHQIPERSLHLWGIQVAVCHRCLGLYVGFWLGTLILPGLTGMRDALLQRPRLLLLFSLPMLIDVALPNSALDRFLTGLLTGFPVSIFVLVALQQLLARTRGGLNESGRTQ